MKTKRIFTLKQLSLAVIIGIFTAFISIGFNDLIDIMVKTTKGLLNSGSLYFVLLPVAAALIMSVIYKVFLKYDNTGLGISQVLFELDNINTFLMRPLGVIIRMTAAAVTLGFGMSAGRFGPIVHLGSAIGSNIGYRFDMDDDTIRLLIGCGASAAISAVFDMPLFAAVFVLEVLYKKQFLNFFAPIVISSVSAGFISDILDGSIHAKQFLSYPVSSDLHSLFLYGIFGIFCALIAIIYMISIDFFTKIFSGFSSVTSALVTAAIAVAAISFLLPYNFELHSNTTWGILNGEFDAGLLIVIALAKIISTGLTLGSGFIGGNFYPGVTIGAASGAAFSHISAMISNSFTYDPFFAFLGTGTVISGYLNAPLSGIILVMEFSQSYSAMLPALISCSVSVSAVYFIYKKDIFSGKENIFIDHIKKTP